MLKIKLSFRIQFLHMFDDGDTVVIAFDHADAVKVWEKWSDDFWDDSYEEFERQSLFGFSSIVCDHDDYSGTLKHVPLFSLEYKDPQTDLMTFRARNIWWVLKNGRGFFSSRDY